LRGVEQRDDAVLLSLGELARGTFRAEPDPTDRRPTSAMFVLDVVVTRDSETSPGQGQRYFFGIAFSNVEDNLDSALTRLGD
jgi:hypothetical protein